MLTQKPNRTILINTLNSSSLVHKKSLNLHAIITCLNVGLNFSPSNSDIHLKLSIILSHIIEIVLTISALLYKYFSLLLSRIEKSWSRVISSETSPGLYHNSSLTAIKPSFAILSFSSSVRLDVSKIIYPCSPSDTTCISSGTIPNLPSESLILKDFICYTHGFPVQLNNGMVTSSKNKRSNRRNGSNRSSRGKPFKR